MWQVQVQRRGIAEERGIIGNYHLCLSDKSLTLVRTGQPRTITGENRVPSVEFLLTTIRRLVYHIISIASYIKNKCFFAIY